MSFQFYAAHTVQQAGGLHSTEMRSCFVVYPWRRPSLRCIHFVVYSWRRPSLRCIHFIAYPWRRPSLRYVHFVVYPWRQPSLRYIHRKHEPADTRFDWWGGRRRFLPGTHRFSQTRGEFWVFNHHYRPRSEANEGYVFTGVCHSVTGMLHSGKRQTPLPLISSQ